MPNNLRDEHDFEEEESVPHSATGLAGSKFNERKREGFVQGSADLEYGEVDGFRYGFEETGHRHERSALGRKVFRGGE
jgi:hypothetical protein